MNFDLTKEERANMSDSITDDDLDMYIRDKIKNDPSFIEDLIKFVKEHKDE